MAYYNLRNEMKWKSVFCEKYERLQFVKQKVCNLRNEKSVLILRNEQVEV